MCRPAECLSRAAMETGFLALTACAATPYPAATWRSWKSRSGIVVMAQIGVDIGGTFTDVVMVGDGAELVRAKVPSTPHDPTDYS